MAYDKGFRIETTNRIEWRLQYRTIAGPCASLPLGFL